MFKVLRRIFALAFWLGITFLFLDISGTGHRFLGWMAKVQFLPSVMRMDFLVITLLLLLTLLMGRIYCSVICPAGVLQDLFAWIGRWRIFRKNRKSKYSNKYSYSQPKTWLRLGTLAIFIIMIVAGFNAAVILLAPYSAYGRMVTALLQPLYIDANNMLANWAEANDSYAFYTVEQHTLPLALTCVASASALILLILAFHGGRTYCNTICPVGTVLGYLSKFSLLKMRVDEDKCIKCGICEKNCKAACIKVEKNSVSRENYKTNSYVFISEAQPTSGKAKGNHVKFDYSRCVACGDCQSVCPKQAISYTPPRKRKHSDKTTADTHEENTLSRRSFLAISGGLLSSAILNGQEKTTDGGLAVIEDKKIPHRQTRLTPPGSFSLRNLQQKCTACQLCIAKCPNGVLRPSENLESFLQPEMQYDRGYCRPECTRCSNVCPAGAIQPISREEKTAIQIGHAVWIKENCIPHVNGNRCGNCAAHCPSGAIQMIPEDTSYKQDRESGKWYDEFGNEADPRSITMIPSINAEKCIGCGACEYLCPARPFSAIYVEGHEVHREI